MRRLIVMGLVVALVLGMASLAVADEVELTLWIDMEPFHHEIVEAAVEEYNELTDGVTIVMETPIIDVERVATAIAAGEGPDILQYNHNVPWFWGIDAVYDLAEFVNDPEIGIEPDRVVDPVRKSAHYGGEVMAIPTHYWPGSIVYNREIFKEAGLSDADAPETWDELVEIGKKLTVWDGDRIVRWGLTPLSIDWFYQEIILTNGGDWVNEDLTEYLPDVERAVESFQHMYDWIHEYEFMPMPMGVSWVGAEDLMTDAEAFAEGRGAMVGFDGFTPSQHFDINPDLDLGAVYSPQGPSAGENPLGGTGMSGWFVMADCEYPREAYLFAKFFYDNYLDTWMEYGNIMVPDPTLLDDPEIAECPLYGRMLKTMDRLQLRNWHNFPYRMDVRAEEAGMVESIMLGIKGIEEAVEDFRAHANSIMETHRDEMQEFVEAQEFVW